MCTGDHGSAALRSRPEKPVCGPPVRLTLARRAAGIMTSHTEIRVRQLRKKLVRVPHRAVQVKAPGRGLLGNRLDWPARSRDNRKAHSPKETHLVHLLACVDFHLVSAWPPTSPRRKQLEVTGMVFQGNIHRILSHDSMAIPSVHLLWVAAAEYLKGLVVLM